MLSRILPFAALLLLCLPLLEIGASIWLAHYIGWYMLLWLVVSVLLGIGLLKSWRITTAWAVLGSLRNGEVPLSRLFWVGRSLLAALLFIFPGPVSDLLAIILLLPWPGGKTIRFDGSSPEPQAQTEDVLEGEYQRVDEISGHLPQGKPRDLN